MAKIILVIPEYNESSTILSVLDEAYEYADLLVVVDDGSKDDSILLVREYASSHPRVYLLCHAQNQGVSGALLTGFSFLDELYRDGRLNPDDVVVTIDADGQHMPTEVPKIAAHLAAGGYDVVLGRRDMSNYPSVKRFGNWALSLWASLLSGFRYRDVECGFRAIRVDALEDLLEFFTGRRYGVCQEIAIITARRGCRISNDFPTAIPYYRVGARVRDGFNNVAMGLLSYLRVVFGVRHSQDSRAEQVFTNLDEPVRMTKVRV
jgi:glycosyltransferase involved in cell wall biosynthesis